MRHLHRTLLALVSITSLAVASAEEPRPEDIDPAVDTSAQSNETATREPENPEPALDASSPQGTPSAPAAQSRDRIELDTTQITGNRELPKVLYIVPWKRADLGDLVGKPVNSLLDEVLTPVDRDVFRRENRYYRALMPDDAAATSGAARPSSGGSVTRPLEDER